MAVSAGSAITLCDFCLASGAGAPKRTGVVALSDIAVNVVEIAVDTTVARHKQRDYLGKRFVRAPCHYRAFDQRVLRVGRRVKRRLLG